MIPLSSEAREQAKDFMRETLQIYPTKKPEVNASRERERERVITWTVEMIRHGFSEHGSRTMVPDMIWSSDYWKAVRGAVLIAYGGKCYICQEKAEEVHHIRPRHLHGSDAPDNLMPLCKRCHDEIHRRLDKGLTDMIESVTASMEADTPRAQRKLEDF